MICAWDELLGILPGWLSAEVDRQGRQTLQELRLRLGQVPELCLSGRSLWLDRIVCREDLNFVVNTASRYSPWSAATISRGYITAIGGHRIGLCGDCVIKKGALDGIRKVNSLCIRVARDYAGISGAASKLRGSILLIGPPGSGKTTLLRDLLMKIAQEESVCVVDERGEIFPEGMTRGRRLDVITGCNKEDGIEILLRTMGPTCIAVDEVTSEQDCEALVRAGWCGVRLIATAHAASTEDLYHRPVYRSLVNARLFDHVIVLNRNRAWKEEPLAQ